MNPYIPPEKSAINGVCESATATRIHTVSGLGFAGFFGGPFAISYLIYRDLVALGRSDMLRVAAAWFGPFILFWLYCLFSLPPDLISQWILYLPQTILWWIVARHLFRDVHASYREHGGLFFPSWRAVGFGLGTLVALKLLFFVGAAGFDRWAQ